MKQRRVNKIIAGFICVVILFATLLSGYAEGAQSRTLTLTKQEREYIRKNPTITIAMDTSWVPYAFMSDQSRQVDGIIRILLDKITAWSGLTVEYEPVNSYIKAIEAVQAGETMLVSGIADNPKMAAKNDVLITDPYIKIYYSAVTKSELTDLYAEGASYRVAVCRGSYSTIAMQEKMPRYEFVEYSSNKECMSAVAKNEVDAALVATTSVEYYRSKHEFSMLHTAIINEFTWGLCFGVSKDCDPVLIGILNKGIAQLTPNDVAQATYASLLTSVQDHRTWIDWIYSQPVAAGGVMVVIAVIVALLVFSILWQRSRTRHLQQLTAALKKAEDANYARVEFLSRMSHDMRTPMNGILGIAALSREEEDPNILREDMKKIEQSGQYLLGLINDTLDFQRIESGKLKISPEATNTSELIGNVVEMVKETAKNKKIDLKVINENADLDGYILVDAMRLKQILINLLSNAVKYTQEGGSIEFRIACRGREAHRSHVEITISDTGVGMSETFLKEGIFKPFSQEKNSMTGLYAGSGLGLSIAKSLVEIMGGTIEVESELGVGTKFTIHMLIDRVDTTDAVWTAHKDEQRQLLAVNALTGKHILLVEDHPLNAEVARRLLEKVGCCVDWAQNGKEGVARYLAVQAGYYDAILMDIRMPVMDGLEAAKAIRASEHGDAKTIAVIAMTANAYQGDIMQSMDAGMDDHLSKPINPQLLYDTLVKYI